MKRILLHFGILLFAFSLSAGIVSAQAPVIAYSTQTNIFTTGTAITAMTPTNTGGAIPATTYATVTTLVNTGTINGPFALANDAAGNIYVADYSNNKIRKVTAAGTVTTLAGSGAASSNDGTGAGATFNGPDGLAIDAAGTNLYVADANGNKIRKIVIATGVVTTIAGTGTAGHANGATALTSTFNAPDGLTMDASGNLFIADFSNNSIREISAGGVVSTLAGGGAGGTTSGNAEGTGTAALFNQPIDLVADGSGNLFVADYLNNKIRQIVIATGVVSTLAGSGTAGSANGTGAAATFSAPASICIDASGNFLVADQNSSKIRMITSAGNVTTIAGSGTSAETNGVGTAAAFSYPVGITVDKSGNCYTGDWANANNGTIRKILLTGYTISPTMPAGLGFTVTSGKISGTPSAVQAETSYIITGWNGSGSSADTITIQCVQTNNWTAGSNTTNWSTAGNWSKNSVPGANDAVQIGVTAYTRNKQPTLNTTTTVNSITFGSVKQGVLTISSNRALTISDGLTVNSGATGATIAGGNSSTSIVNMSPGAGINVSATGKLTLNTLNLVLESDSTGDAYIGQVTSTILTGSALSNITVQRFLKGDNTSAYRGYRLLTTPVYAGAVSGNNVISIDFLKTSMYITATTTGKGFDNVVAANPSLYLYRESLTTPTNTSFTGGNFRGISDITTSPTYGMNELSPYNSINIPVGNGLLCFFRGDRSATSFTNETKTTYKPQSVTMANTGTINIGNIVVKDWYTPASSNLSYTSASPAAGYTLVGNPYASAIDWDTFQRTSLATGGIYGTATVSKTIYILDPVSHNFGSYISGNSGLFGTNNATNIISSGQGFFVIATATTPVQPALTFTESAKTTSQNTGANLLMGKPLNLANNQYLRLKVAKDIANTEDIVVHFNNQVTGNFNNVTDALYRQGYGVINMSGISQDNIKVAIHSMPLPDKQPQVLGLYIGASASGNYTMSLKELNAVPRLYDVWLMDRYIKDSVDMRQNAVYNFSIDKNDTSSFGVTRFKLVIRQNAAYAYRLLSFAASKVSSGAKQVQLNWSTANEGNYTNFTVERSNDGGKTYSVVGGLNASDAGIYGLLDKTPQEGMNQYRLKQEDINNTVSYSNVVNIQYSYQTTSLLSNNLMIYPNPAVNIVNLAVQNQTSDATSFSIRFMNSSGVVVKQVSSPQSSWQGSVSGLEAGTYMIQVLNSKNATLVGQAKLVKM